VLGILKAVAGREIEVVLVVVGETGPNFFRSGFATTNIFCHHFLKIGCSETQLSKKKKTRSDDLMFDAFRTKMIKRKGLLDKKIATTYKR